MHALAHKRTRTYVHTLVCKRTHTSAHVLLYKRMRTCAHKPECARMCAHARVYKLLQDRMARGLSRVKVIGSARDRCGAEGVDVFGRVAHAIDDVAVQVLFGAVRNSEKSMPCRPYSLLWTETESFILLLRNAQKQRSYRLDPSLSTQSFDASEFARLEESTFHF